MINIIVDYAVDTDKYKSDIYMTYGADMYQEKEAGTLL